LLENYFSMNVEKIHEVVNDVKNKPNKDLFESVEILYKEFEETKKLIIDLTRHMDSIEDMYNIINEEIGKRKEIK
jgi:uncharacterized phage infection (PIP) family protein YhgE